MKYACSTPEYLCYYCLTCRYGVGYHLIFEKAPTCDSARVVDLIKCHVPGMRCVVDTGVELSFTLPSQNSKSFPALFYELEGMFYCVYFLYDIAVSYRDNSSIP